MSAPACMHPAPPAFDPRAACAAFGRRLRALRKRHGLSPYELALRARVHETSIRCLERGAREPRLLLILRLAEGLALAPGALLDELQKSAPPRSCSRTGQVIAITDPRTVSATFGRRLGQLRREQRLSQEQLASRAQMWTTALGRTERGGREPRLSTILRLAEALSLPPSALLDAEYTTPDAPGSASPTIPWPGALDPRSMSVTPHPRSSCAPARLPQAFCMIGQTADQ